MSYMDNKLAFAPAGAIQELSFDEVMCVGGGESPSYSTTGRGPNLTPPTAAGISDAANAVSIAAAAAALRAPTRQARAAAEIVAVAAAAVAAAADFFR